MKYVYLSLCLLIISCKEDPKNIFPNSYLSKKDQELFNYKISRYIQRLPKYATEENKFESQFDADYKNSIKDCSLLFYYKDNEGFIYFAISKTAPSIKQEGGARRILITTEPKILVSKIRVEGLRRPSQERIT